MLLLTFELLRVIIVLIIIYFLLRLFFLSRYLRQEERLFVPTVARVLPRWWAMVQKETTLRNRLLGKRKRFHHFLDPGAGDGSTVVQAYALGVADQITGSEIQWGLVIWGWIRITGALLLNWKRTPRPKVHWGHHDLFTLNWSDYDCVYLFMVPSVLTKIAQQLKEKAQPGTVVLSWVFPIPELADRLVSEMTVMALKSPKKLHLYRL